MPQKAWLVFDLVYDESAGCETCGCSEPEFELLAIYLDESAARNHALNAGVQIREAEIAGVSSVARIPPPGQ